MRSVGVICEGPTDRVVLERIVTGVAGSAVAVTAIQPPTPMRPGLDFGGWQQVFASIRRGDVSGALAFNDLVIVQIDTDVCEEPGFDVPRREGGRELSEAELTARCADRLRREIVEHDPGADLDRVVFAVCVDELECWLLLHLTSRTPKVTGCLEAANKSLEKVGAPRLSDSNRYKAPRAYEAAARDLRKPKAIAALRGRSPSLDAFLTELGRKLAPPDASPVPPVRAG